MNIADKILEKIGKIFDEIDYNDLEKKDLIYFLEQKDLMLSFLQQRINKAIEYIEEYQEVLKDHNGDWLNYQDGFKPYLLDILKGVDKE